MVKKIIKLEDKLIKYLKQLKLDFGFKNMSETLEYLIKNQK